MGYLVISRRVNERILIGDDIEILISSITDGKVDVAVSAPKDWKIIRKETHLREDLRYGIRRSDRLRGRD